MNGMDPTSELENLLLRLVGTLKPEDLKDADLAAKLEQAIAMIGPTGEPLDPALVGELKEIPDKIERFKKAAVAVGANKPEDFMKLVDQMKMAGLFE